MPGSSGHARPSSEGPRAKISRNYTIAKCENKINKHSAPLGTPLDSTGRQPATAVCANDETVTATA